MNFTIGDLINAQLNTELWSSYFYLGMSMNAEKRGLKGLAHWLNKESVERHSRAQTLISYMVAKGEEVFFYPIENIPYEWNTLSEIIERIIEHENKISILTDSMVSFGKETKVEKEFMELLMDFSAKQKIKEEDTIQFIDSFRNIAEDKNALSIFDENLISNS